MNSELFAKILFLSVNLMAKDFHAFRLDYSQKILSFIKLFKLLQDEGIFKFEESYSYLGACCSFNYHPEMIHTEEFFKATSFGMNGGLTIIGTGE
jgi:hypothetical protein